VSDQSNDPTSTLSLYRSALRLRRELFATAPPEIEWLEVPDDVLGYRRAGVTVLLNAGEAAVSMPPGELLLSSSAVTDGALPASTAVWLR
jgi:alpha-glucosidase